MSSNITVMKDPGQTVLDLLKEIDHGEMVLDMEVACKDVVAACQYHQKKGSVVLTINFAPDSETETMKVSHKLTKKEPEQTSRASLFFVGDDNTLSRNDPKQRRMFSGEGMY